MPFWLKLESFGKILTHKPCNSQSLKSEHWLKYLRKKVSVTSILAAEGL